MNGRHEIQECQLQDLDRVAERLSKEGKVVLDVFDARECAEKARGLGIYRTEAEPT